MIKAIVYVIAAVLLALWIFPRYCVYGVYLPAMIFESALIKMKKELQENLAELVMSHYD